MGDLAERYLIVQDGAQRKLGAAASSQLASRWAANVYYLSASLTVVLFARAVDPAMRSLEGGSVSRLTLNLLEGTMTMLRTTGNSLLLPGLLLVGAVLIGSGALDLWSTWRSAEASMTRLQLDKADAIAGRIEQHLATLRSQIGWTTQQLTDTVAPEQRRIDLLRLLRQVPAVTEVAQLDSSGNEVLRVSRLAVDRIGSGTSFGSDIRFQQALSRGLYVGPVYLNKQSEPHTSLALTHPRAGVTVAEVNLKALWQDIGSATVGQSGYAYVVDGQGRLISHRDVEQMRRAADLSRLPQVEAALKGPPTRTAVEGNGVDSNRPGAPVVSVHAAVPSAGWRVFVDLPLAEARAPLWSALGRFGSMLGIGLVAALLANRLASRRQTPLQATPAQSQA